jgi:transaldolase
LVESINDLRIKIFADGADLPSMLEMSAKTYIGGLTTNPTLMRKAGITNYRSFAVETLGLIKHKPISFEVFSDDLDEMMRQGTEIASWGQNVFVKIPITTTTGESTDPVIKFLTSKNIKVNVTALMTIDQVERVSKVLNPRVASYVSVFAGRIADTGKNPIPIMEESLRILQSNPCAELIWASPRELLNIIQANEIGCHIITATNDIIKKLDLLNYSLTKYSLDTVNMFYNDAKESKFAI